MIFAKGLYFVVERAAEPLSNRLEGYAARSASFRQLCGYVANNFNRIEFNKQQRRQSRMAMLSGDAWVEADELIEEPSLSEAEATKIGCELLGEGTVLLLAGGVLLHQTLAENAQEAEQDARTRRNEDRLDELEARWRSVDELAARIGELEAEAAAAGAAAAACAVALRSQRESTGSNWWFTRRRASQA